jgi:hypothetical protein
MFDTKRYAGNYKQSKRQIQCLRNSFLELSFLCQAMKARHSFDDAPWPHTWNENISGFDYYLSCLAALKRLILRVVLVSSVWVSYC